MIKITLADGTVVDNIELNGTTFVSKTPIDEKIFENNMSPVEIETVGDGPVDLMASHVIGHHENMTYQHIVSPFEGEYWFGLNDVSQSDLEFAKNRADIEYLAMMMDVEL